MKKLILTSILFIPILLTYGAPVIRAVTNNGNWSTNSTWDLNRVPQTGDTVQIPFGKTVIITNNENISGFLYIKIYGVLKLSGGKLDIGTTGVIIVFSGGKITGTGCSCEQIRIGNVKKYQGDPDVLGPQFASATTSNFDPFVSVLPVKFIGFTLTHTNKDVLVQWSTAEEIDASYFQVERSLDGSNWTSIASVTAAGNSYAVTNYVYTDKNISAHVVYYRIKEVDTDGKFSYTVVKTLKTEKGIAVNIAAVHNQVLLQFAAEIKGNVMVQFISLSGQVVDQQIIRNPIGQVVLSSKIRGNCIISLSNDQSLHIAKQIIL